MTTTGQIMQALARDRKGSRIKTHNAHGYDRGCRCRICVQAWEDRHRYSDHSLEALDARKDEAVQAQRARIAAAWEAYCARLPRGFRPCSPGAFAMVLGDAALMERSGVED